jgi:Cdc6-like AAA superfamily ATPase
MSIAVMKQALEFIAGLGRNHWGNRRAVMDALRAAIEQAEKRQWVELTDDEARALVNRATFGDRTNWQALVYMIDAKLKEKNA